MLRWRFKRDLALGLSFLCLSAIALNSNFAAAVDGDVEVEVGILPVLTITAPTKVRIVLEPGGPATVAEMPVYIGTNNQSGLHAAVSLDKVSNGGDDTLLRSLVNEYDSNYYLAPLEESIVNINDFPFDRWGCTFQDDMRYESLNTSDNPTIHYLTHNPSANEKRYFLCAARASKFQVSGLYNNTIMMTAVPNVLPDTITSITYMQEINETVIASMETDQSYQLVDGRDKKIYWVTKLRDGRVWMTQNLDYDLEAKTDGSQLAEWGTLYPDDTEVDLVSEKNKLYKDGGNLVYDTDTDSYIDSSSLAFNSEKRHYHIGSFYNIEASAREKDDDGDPIIHADVSGICPFSWTVPNGQSSWAMYPSDILSNLISLYGSDMASSLYLAPMGYISSDGTLGNVGVSGYYLGNSRTGSYYYDSRDVLAVNSSYGVSLGNVSDTQGGFIRCVAVPGRRYLISFKNIADDYHVSDTTDFEQSTLPNNKDILTYDTKYSLNLANSLPDNIPDGYTFLGWTTDSNTRTKANVSNIVQLGTAREVITASDEGSNAVSISLYPAWEHNYNELVLSLEDSYEETRTIDDIAYLQEVTPEIVSNTHYNAIKQLVDNRDNKKYWVRKLGDGNLWMEQNLDLTISDSLELTPEDTNVASSRVIVNDGETIIQNPTPGVVGLSSDETALLTDDASEWRRAFGSNYNRAAVLAGSDADSFLVGGEYTESICPKGWQLPSANSTSNVFYRDNYYEVSNYSFANGMLATSTAPNLWSSSDDRGDLVELPDVKVSHTENVNDSGYKSYGYGDNWTNYNIRGTGRTGASSEAHVLSISGADELHVDIYYNGESTSYDWVTVFQGSHPNYSASSTSSTGYIAGPLGGSQSGSYVVNGYSLSSMGYRQIVVPGDTVTFAFRSDTSYNGAGYGYYAIVKGYKVLPRIGGDPLISFGSFDQGLFNFAADGFKVRCVAAKREDTQKTLRHISTMQEMRPDICSASTVGTEVQLKDTRDGQTYFVRKMSDGNCWMMQNLAFGKTRVSELNALTSDLFDRMGMVYELTEVASNDNHQNPRIGLYDGVVTVEYGYPLARIDDIPLNSYFRKFYSGVYYGQGAVSLMHSIGSICPRGWRLPTDSDTFIPDENYSREELSNVYTGGDIVDYGDKVYLTSTYDEENHNITLSNGMQVDFDDVNLYPVRCLAR